MTNNNQIKDAGVYIDPLSDWGWKTLFGSERYKEHLISFINAVYPELEVTDISYDNVEYTGDKEEARSTAFRPYRDEIWSKARRRFLRRSTVALSSRSESCFVPE